MVFRFFLRDIYVGAVRILLGIGDYRDEVQYMKMNENHV